MTAPNLNVVSDVRLVFSSVASDYSQPAGCVTILRTLKNWVLSDLFLEPTATGTTRLLSRVRVYTDAENQYDATTGGAGKILQSCVVMEVSVIPCPIDDIIAANSGHLNLRSDDRHGDWPSGKQDRRTRQGRSRSPTNPA